MNLLPEPTRLKIAARRSVTRWVGLYAASGALLVLITLALRIQQASVHADTQRLEREATLDAEATARLTALQSEIEQLSRTISFNARLALPVLTSDLLAVIAEALPPTMTLNNIAVTPSFASAPPSPNETPMPPSPVTLLVEVSGIARSDLDVASLVATLDQHPLFDRATLEHSRSRDLNGLAVREFALSLEVNLAVRSPIASAPAPKP